MSSIESCYPEEAFYHHCTSQMLPAVREIVEYTPQYYVASLAGLHSSMFQPVLVMLLESCYPQKEHPRMEIRMLVLLD
jgi:hypothetical protein